MDCKNWATKRLWVGLSAHAIFNILMSKPTDAFSLGDKLLVQANVFIMMFTFSIGFYYSKSTNCCEEKKVYLGCSTGRFAECIGCAYPTRSHCWRSSSQRVSYHQRVRRGV